MHVTSYTTSLLVRNIILQSKIDLVIISVKATLHRPINIFSTYILPIDYINIMISTASETLHLTGWLTIIRLQNPQKAKTEKI